jgi:hypothetical protein
MFFQSLTIHHDQIEQIIAHQTKKQQQVAKGLVQQ